MANKVLDMVKVDASLNQDQRHQFSKQLSNVVWIIKVEDSTTKKDEDYAHVAGVCISSTGHILTSSHIIRPDLKYVGSCPSWKGGWTSLRVVKRSMSFGLCLLQLERGSRKETDYTSLAEPGVLNVNREVYGFGHPNIFTIPCTYTFIRGSVEYPCEDVAKLPVCVNDLDRSSTQFLEDTETTYSALKFDMVSALRSAPRRVKDLQCVIDVQRFRPKTIVEMHKEIPLIQIKKFHLGHCGGPVFLSSGHVVGVTLFKFKEINFAVHLSAIKEFLKDTDLAHVNVN